MRPRPSSSPDVPSTTAGTITGAEPVGAEYRSTDGAGVGAFVWMKRPGGKWEVTDGDTGWRRFDKTTLSGIGSAFGFVAIRRIGASVYFTPNDVQVTTAGKVALGIGALSVPGFSLSGWQVSGMYREGSSVGTVFWNSSGFGINCSIGVWTSGMLTAPTADPWPTTLPGSPA